MSEALKRPRRDADQHLPLMLKLEESMELYLQPSMSSWCTQRKCYIFLATVHRPTSLSRNSTDVQLRKEINTLFYTHSPLPSQIHLQKHLPF